MGRRIQVVGRGGYNAGSFLALTVSPPLSQPADIRHVTFLGNYLPRRCGIATFTTDLSGAISSEFPDLDCGVVAMNDPGMRHAYGDRVRFEVTESDLASYRRAADYLNVGATDVLSVQHEYGIFGGRSGSHVLLLLRELRMPIVTTLHTMLSEPSVEQKHVMDELVRLSTRLVVMSQHAAELLGAVHNVPSEKIDLIPHGIPNLPRSLFSKAQLGVEGKRVILTFGLLSPDKGLAYVIEALPRIVQRHPNAIYMVVGATHPHIKKQSGESYRRELALLAHRLGVDGNIVFHSRFVSLSELVEFLSAADIYVTPYINQEQSTSGTLAYAVGAGKAVISTPYRYARELLADGRGLLVPPRDSTALAVAICDILDDPERQAALGSSAAAFGREMLWPSVAQRYMRTFEQAKKEHASQRRTAFATQTLATRPMDLPERSFQHLWAMTDGTGLVQHATFSVPRYKDGYCLDDNARALLLMALVEDTGSEDPTATQALSLRYLAFVNYAFDSGTERFRNFMTYDRHWSERCGSEDSQGRALWALGAVVGRSPDPGRKNLSSHLFHAALPATSSFESPRGWALALLGINEYLRAFEGDSGVGATRAVLAEKLWSRFERNTGSDWPWCENIVTYDNARLPQALIVSGSRMGRDDMVRTGLAALRWLAKIQRTSEGHFSPIGSNGFYSRGSSMAHFDQQPLEASAMVSACLEAWRHTEDEYWADEMRRAFRWFLGHNTLHAPLHDASTGGCYDGLHESRVNLNQGAESTVSFLLAHTEMGMLDGELRLLKENASHAALRKPCPT